MEEMAGGLTPNDIMQGIDGEGGDIFKEMEISQMDYEMYIDKETYHLNQFNMNMDMDMEMDGESASIVQSIKSDYSNINEINPRSEEHTSELQSRFDLVCRLLLEKKNKH